MQLLDIPRLTEHTFVAAVEHFDSLASTQDRAHAAAASPDGQQPLLVVADSQTAGRGRAGNRWWTGQGSLAFSLLCDPATWNVSRSPSPVHALTAAVALVEAVEPRLAPLTVGLHWPNDLFVERRKLAGILLDVLADGRWVLGVGLNTNNRFEGAPPEVSARAVSMCELSGAPVDHTALLVDFLAALERVMRLSAAGSPELGRRFDELCLQNGSRLTLEVGSERITGYCEGIAADGALCLATPQGSRRYYCGSIR